MAWPPPVFWSSTPHELFAAIRGRSEQNRAASGGDWIEAAKQFAGTVPERSGSIRGGAGA